MNIALRKSWTQDEFFSWAQSQEIRYEFDGFEPVAMTGGADAHEAIGGTLRALLQERLRGKPCRVRGPTLKIEVMDRIRYPDAFVYCTPVPPGETVIKEPVVVFEVVSEDTARTDRIEKLREYKAVPSIQRYVIPEQKTTAAVVFERRGDEWVAFGITEQDTLHMPEIGIEVPLAELYESLDLATTQTD